MNEKIIEEINNLFVPTKCIQDITDDIQYIRRMASSSNYEKEPTCMLVTGETGTGKSEFIKQYKNHFPSREEEERTKIPVLVSLIPKAKHPKPVVSQLLRDLGDPLDGNGGDSIALTHRLITLLRGTGVELIILDEFQHLIETKSNQVVYDIADFIKTLVSKAKIPVVIFGLPWSSYVLTVNVQLARRFSMQHELINYTLEKYSDFGKFVDKIQLKLPIKPEQDLRQREMLFRLFAASEGNISNLMDKIIRPAAISAVDNDDLLIKKDYFAKALKRFSQVRDELNPFLIEIEKVKAHVQKQSSYWNQSVRRGETRVVDMTRTTINFSDLSLKDVF